MCYCIANIHAFQVPSIFLTTPIMCMFAAPPHSSIKGHADLSGPHGPKLYSSGECLKNWNIRLSQANPNDTFSGQESACRFVMFPIKPGAARQYVPTPPVRPCSKRQNPFRFSQRPFQVPPERLESPSPKSSPVPVPWLLCPGARPR